MAKRQFTVRNPEAFAAKQRKASAAAALKRQQTPILFWERVEKSDGCWIWRGPQSDRGYGRSSFGGKIWATHRYAWTITNGPIPKGIQVCHRCDNPLCVRPEHLFLGSGSDNMQDAKRKGRAYQPGQHGTQGADGRWTPKKKN